jgi:hypothetical protein
MVIIVAGLVTCDDKKTHLILVSNLLREIMVYTVEKLSFIMALLQLCRLWRAGRTITKLI